MKMKIFSSTFLFSMLLLSLVFDRSNADRFYCTGSGSNRIKIDHGQRIEHSIIPEATDNNGVESNGGHCTWHFHHSSATAVNLVLQGINRTLLTDVRLLRNERSIKDSDTGLKNNAPVAFGIRYSKDASCGSEAATDFAANLTLNTFKVVSLDPGDTLILNIQRHQPNQSPFGMRISAIDVGYCTRVTRRYRLNCHHITTGNLLLTETFQFMGQSSMQLANFENLTDLQNFIESNKIPENVYPIKEALDLTNPVRIGLFHANDGELKRFVRNDGSCGMETFGTYSKLTQKHWSSKADAHCVSLRVSSSGSPVIELVSCDQPMPALISFLETPLAKSCLDCSRQIQLLMVPKSENLEILKKKTWHPFLIAGALCFVLITVIAVIILVVKSRNRDCLKSKIQEAETQIENEIRLLQEPNQRDVQLVCAAETFKSDTSSSSSGYESPADSIECV